MMIPTITPNNPRALPKISMTRIFTKRDEFWASDNAQLLPMIPTHRLFPGQKNCEYMLSKEGKKDVYWKVNTNGRC